MKLIKHYTTLILALPLLLSACVTDEFGNRRPYTDTEKGAMIGAATGALIGAATQKDGSRRGKAALIGAVGGGLAGATVGHYMDKHKKDLEKALMAERNANAIHVDRVAETVLKVTMTSETAFDVDSSTIKGGFYSTMDKISNVVVRYGKTALTVVGHTDSSGSDQYNQSLSERRARAVSNYMGQKGVAQQRLAAVGKGESNPIATNATTQGKASNRRVEIYIEAIVADS